MRANLLKFTKTGKPKYDGIILDRDEAQLFDQLLRAYLTSATEDEKSTEMFEYAVYLLESLGPWLDGKGAWNWK